MGIDFSSETNLIHWIFSLYFRSGLGIKLTEAK